MLRRNKYSALHTIISRAVDQKNLYDDIKNKSYNTHKAREEGIMSRNNYRDNMYLSMAMSLGHIGLDPASMTNTAIRKRFEIELFADTWEKL